MPQASEDLAWLRPIWKEKASLLKLLFVFLLLFSDCSTVRVDKLWASSCNILSEPKAVGGYWTWKICHPSRQKLYFLIFQIFNPTRFFKTQSSVKHRFEIVIISQAHKMLKKCHHSVEFMRYVIVYNTRCLMLIEFPPLLSLEMVYSAVIPPACCFCW